MSWVIIGRQQWLVLSHYEAVIDVIGSVEGIDAFIYWKSEIWSGVTADWQLTQWQILKGRATQLLISRSGAVVTQLQPKNPDLYLQKSLIILKLGSLIAISLEDIANAIDMIWR